MFWGMNPHTLKPYEEAEKIKMQKQNIVAHRQGSYFFDALTIALCNSFAPKGTPFKPYINEPYHIFPLTEEEKSQKVEIERQKAIAFFTSMVPNKDN